MSDTVYNVLESYDPKVVAFLNDQLVSDNRVDFNVFYPVPQELRQYGSPLQACNTEEEFRELYAENPEALAGCADLERLKEGVYVYKGDGKIHGISRTYRHYLLIRHGAWHPLDWQENTWGCYNAVKTYETGSKIRFDTSCREPYGAICKLAGRMFCALGSEALFTWKYRSEGNVWGGEAEVSKGRVDIIDTWGDVEDD